eukprot:TRINITY_DN15928_c0_g1_i1.p1 TRINITY_DN15928_c0_g1~~TRINITY_DN15928_c0_g1_i1.p1  ORF type:complete len:101 (+),score=27.33 TRINITY_DN15928_c0_g1_i1:59-361(+)
MSQEAILKRAYSERSDVWAFGCTFFELFINKNLYDGYDLMQVGSLVSHGELRLKVPEGIPIVTDLLNSCFEFDPAKRSTFSKIVKKLDSLEENHIELLNK